MIEVNHEVHNIFVSRKFGAIWYIIWPFSHFLVRFSEMNSWLVLFPDQVPDFHSYWGPP